MLAWFAHARAGSNHDRGDGRAGHVPGGGGVAQAAGPAVSLTIQLSPASILADGSSTSTVTVTVLDANGAGVAGQNIKLVSADNGITFSRPQDNGEGTYTSTLISSATAETSRVFAEDISAPASPFDTALLTETADSTTSLAVVSNGPVTSTNLPVTDQNVTLFATVTVSPGNVSPSGTVAFENGGNPIPGCAAVPTPPPASPSVMVTCATSFAAASSPARLTAVFTPDPGSLVTGSTSPAQTVPINRAPTSTAVTMPGSKAHVGKAVRFTALVTPSNSGSPAPSGSVQFTDNGKAIGSCPGQAVGTSSTATCTVTYDRPGLHDIAASYSGDASFGGSTSAPSALAVQALGTITATMQWTFYHTPTYTQVLALMVSGAPTRATILVKCHGHGCPFRKRAIATGGTKRCGPRGRHRCAAHPTIDLTRRFRHKRLRVGAKIIVEISKPGWVGKRYTFTVRARRSPRVRIG